MRRCVILLWILAVLTVPVLALDVLEEERQILNVDTLTDGLPDDAQDALRTYSPAARTDPGEAILAIIKWASGLSVSTLREATPYPKAVTIHGEATPAQKQQLQQYLEQTFAIPVQRQVWTP